MTKMYILRKYAVNIEILKSYSLKVLYHKGRVHCLQSSMSLRDKENASGTRQNFYLLTDSNFNLAKNTREVLSVKFEFLSGTR